MKISMLNMMKEGQLIFNDLGITVIRFPNNAIDKNFNSVCDEIEKVVSALELIMKT